MGSQVTRFKYTIAHGFPTGSAADLFVRAIAEECERNGITGKRAKIGTHMTIFPTYWATEKTARRDAGLIKLALGQASVPFTIMKIVGTGFFPATSDGGNEAFHLRFELHPAYHDLICRLKVSDLFEWVTPPERTTPVDPIYIPHVHIIEGLDLVRRIAPLRERFDLMVRGREVEVYPIQLLRKNEVGDGSPWETVVI